MERYIFRISTYLVRIRPGSPLQRNIAACRNWRQQLRRRASTTLVPTTLHIDQTEVCDGAIALDWAEDAVRNRAVVGIGIGQVAGVILVVKPSFLDVAMGRDGGEEGRSGNEGGSDGLHFGSSVWCSRWRDPLID